VRPLVVFRCASCRHAVFPRRLHCPRCGVAEFAEEETAHGTLEEVTAADVRVGSVRTAAGPLVVARVEDDVERGEVEVGRGDDDAIVAYRASR
jgi:uncharacterized OB-fold protein